LDWTIEWDPRTEKILRKLGPKTSRAIIAFMVKRIALLADPRLQGRPLGGDLHGMWRYRHEDYRIVCRIQDEKLVVLVIHVGHRSDVYETLQ
jgi:mRNA interferase RelE/StbE